MHNKTLVVPPSSLCLAIALALAANVPGAAAQTALEEVIVTAQKREESIQSTPISMAAFNSESLEKMGVTDAMKINGTVPNVVLNEFPANRHTAIVFIRGVGNAGVQGTQDPAVGIYIDGVYLGRASGLATDVADLQRVEVLRGPQGTLYGRNTTGGAINLITAQPEQALQFRQQLSFGNLDYWRSQTTLNLPVTDQLAARLSYMASRRNGYIENDGPGRDFGEDDKEAGRVALRWTPTDTLTVDYAYDRSRASGGPAAFQLTGATPTYALGAASRPNPYAPYAHAGKLTTLSLQNPAELIDRVSGHALTVNWELGETTLKSITAYRELDSRQAFDYSGSVHHFKGVTVPRIHGLLPGGAEIFASEARTEQDQFSQELQWFGTALDDRLDYIAGLYYFQESAAELQETRNNSTALLYAMPSVNALNAGFSTPALVAGYNAVVPAIWSGHRVHSKAKSHAVYTQIGYTPDVLDDKLKLTLGLRFTRDRRTASKLGTVFEPGLLTGHVAGAVVDQWYQRGSVDSSRFSPAFIADYQWTDDVKFYAKYSEAYRAGGFAGNAPRESFGDGYDPEDLQAFEIGVKSDLLDQRVRLNAAVFHYDYDDLQVNQSVPGNIAATNIFNAGSAKYTGYEIDLTVLLAEGLQASLNYGHLNARYKEFLDFNAATGRIEDVSSQRKAPLAPEDSYTVALDYTFPALAFGELSARLQYHWESASRFTANTRLNSERDSYGLLDASVQLSRIAVGDGSLKFQLWGKNLADEDYETYKLDFGGPVQLTSFGDPRSYGLDLTYEY